MASLVALRSHATLKSRATRRIELAKLSVATVIAAMLANTLVYFIGDALVGYDDDFVVLSTIGGTYFFTGICSIVAVLVFAALVRFTANPVRNFTLTGAVVLPLSIVPDLTYIPTVDGSSNAQTAVLILMHIVAAAVIVGLLRTFRPHGR